MSVMLCSLDCIQCPKCKETVFTRHLKMEENEPEMVQCSLCKTVITIVQDGHTMKVTYKEVGAVS